MPSNIYEPSPLPVVNGARLAPQRDADYRVDTTRRMRPELAQARVSAAADLPAVLGSDVAYLEAKHPMRRAGS